MNLKMVAKKTTKVLTKKKINNYLVIDRRSEPETGELKLPNLNNSTQRIYLEVFVLKTDPKAQEEKNFESRPTTHYLMMIIQKVSFSFSSASFLAQKLRHFS